MKFYGLDTETEDKLLKERGTSWAFGEGHVIVTGIYDAQKKAKIPLDGAGGKTVYELLTDPDVTLVGARIIYDIGWLCYEHKIRVRDVKCSLIDVALVESVIDEYQRYALDDLAWKYLKERKGSEYLASWAKSKGLKGDFRKHLALAWEEVPDEVRRYVISDADQPYRIWEKQKEIIEERGLWAPVIRKNKLIKTMLAMKQRGVRVDVKKKAENYIVLKGHQDRLAADFEAKYGKVNFGSPKQLAELFTEHNIPYRHKIRIKGRIGGDVYVGEDLWNERKKLKNSFSGIRIIKGQLVVFVARQYAARTAAELTRMGYAVTSNPNIDKKALEALRKTYPLAQEIIDLKQVTSIIDKFLGLKFDRFIAPDGRIHCDFNISGARQTGRFSSSAPNLQQVPSKTVLFRKTDHEINLAKMCREVLIPDDGMFIGKMDYSGQENVLMAHFAVGRGAKEIRKKYQDNPEFDFHGYMGEATGLYEEYGPEVGRKYAKNCFSAETFIETKDGLIRGKYLYGSTVALDGTLQGEHHVIEKREGYAVELSNGVILNVTRDHRFRWFDKKEPYFEKISPSRVGSQIGFRPAEHFGGYKSFTLGEDLRSNGHSGLLRFDEATAYFCGCYVGDGSVSKGKYGYGDIGIILHDFNVAAIESWLLFGKLGKYSVYDNGAVACRISSIALGTWLMENFGRVCKDKKLPDFLFSSPRSVQLSFIAGLIDSDGRKRNSGFETFSVNEQLVRQEALLCMSLGYRATLYCEPYKHVIPMNNSGKIYEGSMYRLNVYECCDIDTIPALKAGGQKGKIDTSRGWSILRSEFGKVSWSEDKALYYYLKGQAKSLRRETVARLSLPHADYLPATVIAVTPIEHMDTLVMETDTHYFRALVDSPNCSFGLGYGMQVTTMMETFGWDKEQAEHIMEVYNDAAPFVRETMDAVSKAIVERGFIRTLGGKQLHLQKFRGKVDARGAYKGFNKLIQGSAADMMEEALVKIYDAGLDDVFPLYLTVHDEIDFGVPKTREALGRLGELKVIMENAILKNDGTPALLVPIRVDPELGPNWGTMHDFAKNKAKFMKKVAA